MLQQAEWAAQNREVLVPLAMVKGEIPPTATFELIRLISSS